VCARVITCFSCVSGERGVEGGWADTFFLLLLLFRSVSSGGHYPREPGASIRLDAAGLGPARGATRGEETRCTAERGGGEEWKRAAENSEYMPHPVRVSV